MIAIATIFIMLASPFALWYGGMDTEAAFTGLYVVCSLPSIYQICADAIKHKTWPRIVSGPSVGFGRYRVGGHGIHKN